MRRYLLLTTFALVLFWSFVIHPFEIPDEQSHYATVHYLVDKGQVPTYSDKQNLSLEEQEAQYIFGIMTDGTNKYMYRPDYRMEYIDGYIGKYEIDLFNLNTNENRKTYTIHQAAIYPPLYYYFASLFYRIVEGGDIILRLFITRLSSVILTSLLVLIAYKIGCEIFRQKIYGVTLALMTLFYPMTTYIGSGVNSDNLHNLLFACFIYLTLRFLRSGWSARQSLLIGVVIGLDIITKPQGYIMLPILGLAVILRLRLSEWRLCLRHLPLIILPILALAGWQEVPKFTNTGQVAYAAQTVNYGGWDNFVSYSREYLHRLFSAMIVWYWGVFKWLGITIPRPFWWLANRLLLVSIFVVLVRLGSDIFKRKLSWLSKVSLFALGSNLIYVVALFWFDWQFYQEYGRSLGMQARYYMPLLTLQMFLLLHGITSLGFTKKLKKYLRQGLVLFFLSLQLAGIYTLASSYYDLWPINTLISQMSQYKPFFAKGEWWYLWGALYIVSLLTLTHFALFTHKQKLTK